MPGFDETFARLRAERRLGLFPYLMAGFPDLKTSPTILGAMADAGADGFEIGIPFSDPMADGLTMQRSNEAALRGGANIMHAFELARSVTSRKPAVLMGYYNPILSLGLAEFCRSAKQVGADGVIVPDLPPEEADDLREACQVAGIHYVYFLAPTSTPDRIKRVAKVASGFLYCVALVGVTGARTELSDELPDFLKRVRDATDVPLVLGFGISQPEHIRRVHGLVDGVIVSSAIADLLEQTSPDQRAKAVGDRVRELKAST